MGVKSSLLNMEGETRGKHVFVARVITQNVAWMRCIIINFMVADRLLFPDRIRWFQ